MSINRQPPPLLLVAVSNSKKMKNNNYKIKVDDRTFDVESSIMTGKQIKELADVPVEKDLLIQLHGHKEKIVADDETVNISLPGIEKFESRDHQGGEHQQVIHINTDDVIYTESEISYEKLLKLAGKNPAPNTEYSVLYFNGPKENPKGKMVTGDVVKVQDKMVFNVTGTIRS